MSKLREAVQSSLTAMSLLITKRMGAEQIREGLQVIRKNIVDALAQPDSNLTSDHIADYLADNMPMKKYSLDEIEAMVRNVPAQPALALPDAQPTIATEPVKLSDEELKGIIVLIVEKHWTISEVARAIEAAIHAKQAKP